MMHGITLQHTGTDIKREFLRILYSRRAIIFGSYSSNLTKNHKINSWKEVFAECWNLGMPLEGRDYTYLRDTYWQNIRRVAVGKRNKKKELGEDAGSQIKYTEIDEMVFDIIGRDDECPPEPELIMPSCTADIIKQEVLNTAGFDDESFPIQEGLEDIHQPSSIAGPETTNVLAESLIESVVTNGSIPVDECPLQGYPAPARSADPGCFASSKPLPPQERTGHRKRCYNELVSPSTSTAVAPDTNADRWKRVRLELEVRESRLRCENLELQNLELRRRCVNWDLHNEKLRLENQLLGERLSAQFDSYTTGQNFTSMDSGRENYTPRSGT